MKKWYEYKTLFCILLALMSFTGCSKTVKKESDVDTVQNHYLAGIQKLAKNDVKAAEADFTRTIQLDRNSPMGYTGMALLELSRNDYKRALKQAKKALKKDSEFGDAYIAEGRILTERGKKKWFEEAISSFEHALKIDPENQRALFYCAECYLKKYEFNAAMDYYRQAAEKTGDLKNISEKRLNLVSKIISANPVSDAGKKIMLKENINRSDLCVLLVEELKIIELLARNRTELFGMHYNDDFTLKNNQVKVPADIKSKEMGKWILDVLPLHISELDVLPDGNFYPDRFITRAQLAVIIQGIFVLLRDDPTISTQYVGTQSDFVDVRPDYYAFNAIMLCVNEGIFKTDSSTGSFSPQENVHGADVFLMLRNLKSVF